jgi:hypothetical protein
VRGAARSLRRARHAFVRDPREPDARRDHREGFVDLVDDCLKRAADPLARFAQPHLAGLLEEAFCLGLVGGQAEASEVGDTEVGAALGFLTFARFLAHLAPAFVVHRHVEAVNEIRRDVDTRLQVAFFAGPNRPLYQRLRNAVASIRRAARRSRPGCREGLREQ